MRASRLFSRPFSRSFSAATALYGSALPQPKPFMSMTLQDMSGTSGVVAVVVAIIGASVAVGTLLSRHEHSSDVAIARLEARMAGTASELEARMAGVMKEVDAKVAGTTEAITREVNAKIAGTIKEIDAKVASIKDTADKTVRAERRIVHAHALVSRALPPPPLRQYVHRK
jgi:multidrug efflux pump subunit AcrA (membrane-fusion protein)